MALQIQTLTIPPKKYFLCFSRFLSQFLSRDPYDPPFSPSSKPPKLKKTNKKDPSHAKDPTLNRPLKSDLPFDFRYSYSETNPSVEPIGFREPPRFSPFGPGRLDRRWTGTSAPAQQQVDPESVAQARSRVLGDPLTEEEVAELVEHYRHSDCASQINLARNGVYMNVVARVREALETEEVVRLDCTHVGTSDCKKIGLKLKDLVPCVPILFNNEQIILWRGKREQEQESNLLKEDTSAKMLG
ncbi:hypothetical protein I3842_11G185300 [Carya illinoinensis]|uniref:CRM domain-containing protein n=1 Tax=Carya illinoinensis TaxID=32201 RepID=A0A922J103_CARIL|nr:hypothetical protein I3842_11G185300 [Carya illinoinensis]